MKVCVFGAGNMGARITEVFLNAGHDVTMIDIKPEFTRKNLSNIQSKAQVLAEMLNNSKIHPKLAFQYSGLFSDPEEAFRISMAYYEENQRKMERSLRNELAAERDNGDNLSNPQDGGGDAE